MTDDVEDFARRLIATLDQVGVPYMVAGSFASTYHGVPRTTHDLDLVVEISADRLEALLSALSPDDWYVDPETARDSVRRSRPFNVIDEHTGWKADVIPRNGREFSREEFQRRQRANLFGSDVWVASAEDTIVAKLEWSVRSGGSERQRADVRGILQMRGTDLDRAYIDRWVRELGLDAEWAAASQ